VTLLPLVLCLTPTVHASVHPSIHLVTLYVLSQFILSLSKVVNYYYDGEHTYIPGELYDDGDKMVVLMMIMVVVMMVMMVMMMMQLI
jgi:uncharacterized BrkB/YihY/UPF0761 family membrane protein